jgi:type VI secretion system protein ImpF
MNGEEPNLYASLLDRLIDNEPDLRIESRQSSSASFRDIKESVSRDIEQLLNTRRNITVVPVSCPETERSLFTYGLKDYTHESPDNAIFVESILKDIRRSILMFEPRLKNVYVHVDTEIRDFQGFGFKISALLVVDPISEPVVFDTRLDPKDSKYHVN